ncbi:MAG TPA: CPBP family glutamic-type intramembrane protease [Candidatus Binataceae bacterium]|nr:CPBP family glutamic-type intramembrane protease [Candidatus Binataceae bacterium]
MLIAVAPYTRLAYLFYRVLSALGMHRDLWQITWLGDEIFQVAFLVAIIQLMERRPLASIGLCHPGLMDLIWGIGAFAIISLGSELWSFAIPLSEDAHSQVAQWTSQWASQSGAWRITLVVSASIFEEFYFRGYLIERVQEITGSVLVGVVVGTALNLYIHSTYWSAYYVASIAFDQLALALLYLWRRSVATCIVTHFLLDAAFV